MLYLVSTPIGNLEDISLRALKILSSCAYVLCEDTRVSKILFEKYDIKTSLVAFHKFNEKKEEQKVLKDLENGQEIAIISDAGTPLISDPGHFLVQKCFEKSIKVESIPGACSVIEAIILSGFETYPFQFKGFFPKKPSELIFFIKSMLFFNGSSVAFESAKRIKKVIELIAKIDPQRELVILKELTKKFENRFFAKAKDMLSLLKDKNLKGEFIIVTKKGSIPEDLSVEETIKLLQNFHGLDLKDAIKIAAKIKNISKKKVYKTSKIK